MTIIEIVFLTIMLTVLIVSLVTLHKVRHVHLQTYVLQQKIEQFPDILNQSYRQLQALISLEKLLSLSYPLPPLRGWAASPDFLLILAKYALEAVPKTYVECSSGASTIILAQCAKQNGTGHVYSLEHDSHYAKQTKDELRKHGLEMWATVIHAPLKEYIYNDEIYQWYQFDTSMINNKIDMLVIDGPPAYLNKCARYPAGPVLIPLLDNNSAVFLDDADRVDEQMIIERWMNDVPFIKKEYECEKGAIGLFKTDKDVF